MTAAEVAAAGRHLAGGGVVAYPTETFYGLGADPSIGSALDRVLELKGRDVGLDRVLELKGRGADLDRVVEFKGRGAGLDRALERKGRRAGDKPLLLLAATLDQLAPWVGTFPPGFDVLAARFWPGPLTLVVPAKPDLPAPLRGPTGGVAVRLTPHPVARALVQAYGSAITATSANRGAEPPACDAAQARAAFDSSEVLVLDGGATAAQQPSSLVDLTGASPRVLRPGAIPRAALETALEAIGRPTGDR